MIVVTGGLGFIGKNLVNELIARGNEVMVLDTKRTELSDIRQWLGKNKDIIEVIYHLGAITDTTLTNESEFNVYNLTFSIFLWNLCATYGMPLLYAISAATYGDGSYGFDDDIDVNILRPLNPYGWSKQKFDIFTKNSWVRPPYWYGLKFFNVYGYGESHKGRMASVVLHAYN